MALGTMTLATQATLRQLASEGTAAARGSSQP